MIIKNTLIEWWDQAGETQIERVLLLDRTKDLAVTIDIKDEQALPIAQAVSQIETRLEQNMGHILEKDPYAYLHRPEEAISQEHRDRRNALWSLIEDVAEIYSAPERGQAIANLAESRHIHKSTIYKHLRRFWQGGGIKNALLPRPYRLGEKRSGAKKKSKAPKGGKRGRPRRYANEPHGSRGVNATEEVKQKFRQGLKKFYKGKLKVAYKKTMAEYFNIGYEMKNGALVPILPEESELPSPRQFRYWYEKERNLEDELKAIHGERKFKLKHRGILGSSTQMAFGPGFDFQVDATIGDLYLVSVLDRSRIIGRPVIYVISDLFSRMIAGISVSLEGPSWAGAMLTLDNLVVDKVGFCAQHNIEIKPEDWPCIYLPEQLIADRGEFEGFAADTLVNSCGIQLSNTPPFRPDWKGVVEQNFNLINNELINWLPGAVNKRRERGDKDYRLDACLTLPEFRRLMVLCVLKHNQTHRLRDYPLSAAMIEDHVEPYPLELWNWGLENRTGRLRTMPRETLRLNILPRGEASVTRTGIMFERLTYVNQRALDEQWFVKARYQGNWHIPVAYDPWTTKVIYWCPENGAPLEPLELSSKDVERFGECSFYDVRDTFALQDQAHAAAMPRQIEADAAFAAQINQTVETAQALAAEAVEGMSKAQRLNSIDDNRQQERELERKGMTSQSLQPSTTLPPEKTSALTEKGLTYVPPAQYTEELFATLEEESNEQSN